MKKTLNSLFVVGGLLLMSGALNVARAQSGSEGSGQSQAAAEQQNEQGKPDLNLTNDQKTQMQKIREETKPQIEAVKNDSSLSATQKQAKIAQIRQGARKQEEAILTPEQEKTMRKWRREHKGSRRQQTPPPPPSN